MATDLVPALMTTHTVKNPEYDPTVIPETIAEEHEDAQVEEHDNQDTMIADSSSASAMDKSDHVGKASKTSDPFGEEDEDVQPPPPYSTGSASSSHQHTPVVPEKKLKSINPFGDDDEDPMEHLAPSAPKPSKPTLPSPSSAKTTLPIPDVGESDIAGSFQELEIGAQKETEEGINDSTADKGADDLKGTEHKPQNAEEVVQRGQREEGPKQSEAIPGVSTALSKTDENVTLDIRWTVVGLNLPSVFLIESR